MTRLAFLSCCLLSLLLLTGSGHARHARGDSTAATGPTVLKLVNVGSSTVTCTPTYGFLPCTTVIWGNLFLIVVYEYLLSLSQKYLTQGSALFFKMFGTGIFGASMFQILGAFPPVVILLVNGLSGSTGTAETLSAMGLAMLAGSAVMALTLQWGAVVAFGSRDLSQTSSSAAPQLAFSITGYGVTQDADTKRIAKLLLIAMIPFAILQLPQIVDSTTVTSVAVVAALILSAAGLIIYCIYEIFQPLIQTKTLEYIMQDFLEDSVFPGLLSADGEPDEAAIQQLFHKLNKNSDEEVSADELEALFLGAQLKDAGLESEDYVANLMRQFDKSQDNKVSSAEFIRGMKRLLTGSDSAGASLSSPATDVTETLLSGEKTSPTTAKVVGTWLNYAKAGYLLVLGTGISLLLAQPLMAAIEDFADGLSVPSFIITYIIVPFAMSYKQVILAVTSARKKTVKAVSLTFSTIYSSVYMSSMMSLTMFLLIVYVRGLTWDVSAGVLVVLIVGVVMGCLTSFRITFPFWTCILAFLLYPISLVLIYVLTTYCGWS
uniref:EF-hand domain-containing protein n=1 Tax=Kalanchoe fedtschenkoi TaxID=63787 RepID=A0A7N0U4D4_KALFE